MMGKIGLQKGEPIAHSMLNSAIEKAQKKVEERNFDIRKHLLEYDDVLNEQRNFIYSERDRILEDEHLVERCYSAIQEFVNEGAENVKRASKDEFEEKLELFRSDLKSKFGYTLTESDCDKIARNQNVADEIFQAIKQEIVEKEKITGEQNLTFLFAFNISILLIRRGLTIWKLWKIYVRLCTYVHTDKKILSLNIKMKALMCSIR